MVDITSKILTKEEHIERHEVLHNCLDELVADFVTLTNKLPSETSIMELLMWSMLQTLDPNNPNDKIILEG